ncbi:MAG: 3D domain-containing protein [Candidatus Pacebacteria bacterium]|jgi:3D (Asp-Asp-Asp) domain-containing protein|nr:3D domain-containing protein [Candidatus Paceibacterota bacterium]
MCIGFKGRILKKMAFIGALSVSGLLMAVQIATVQAQWNSQISGNSRKVAVYDKASRLMFCGTMFSRANFLEIKSDPIVCSKDHPVAKENESVRRIKVVLTAYSSTVEQTDDTPFITANGSYVHDGIVANNGLPFGTEIRIPELYGTKVFTVEDRMHQSKGSYNFDIWFPTYEQARNFGVKYAYVEVLAKK